MSEIKNGGLDQYGVKAFEQQQSGTSGVEGVKETASWHMDWPRELCTQKCYATSGIEPWSAGCCHCCRPSFPGWRRRLRQPRPESARSAGVVVSEAAGYSSRDDEEIR